LPHRRTEGRCETDSAFSRTLPVVGLSADGPGTLPPDSLRFDRGIARLESVSWAAGSAGKIRLADGEIIRELYIHTLPNWFSILPPLIAILTAILFRQVMVSLFLGVWLGATLIHRYNLFTGILRTLDHYFVLGKVIHMNGSGRAVQRESMG